MGAGKTSVGRRLAKHLDRRFVDTDAVIATEHGAIPHLFATLGEGAFRVIERDGRRSASCDRARSWRSAAAPCWTRRPRSALAGCTVVLLTVSEDAVARGSPAGSGRC